MTTQDAEAAAPAPPTAPPAPATWQAAGLGEAQAAQRLRTDGPNRLKALQAPGLPLLALRQFRSPLVWILVLGAALATWAGSMRDAGLILVILLGTAALGFVQEARAHRAIALLQRRLSLQAWVWRGGAPVCIPVDGLVAGDWVALRAGQLVPADGVLTEGLHLSVVEAALTGESMPVDKRVGADERLWMGSSVRSGTAWMRVEHTGTRTRLAQSAVHLGRLHAPSAFSRGVHDFGVLLLQIMLAVVVLSVLAHAAQGRPVADSVMFAMALAVGLSPEMLPAIVTITLARGAGHLAREGAFVRRLEVLEDLGSLDVLCTDKTGTLTQGEMTLVDAVDAAGHADESVWRWGVLNALLETGIGNPLDAALVASARARGWQAEGVEKLAELPYDFERRRLTVAVRQAADGSVRLITKGAVREVMAICSTWRNPAAPQAQTLDDAVRSRLEAAIAEHGRQGLRVLAVATRVMPTPAPDKDTESDMTLEGFLLFRDPIRDEAPQAVQALRQQGVRVKLITGDNRHVAAWVAAQVGLNASTVLCGDELARMSDEALWHRVRQVDTYAEIDPQQKERLVRALQRSMGVVGFLGDGINDAPALFAAHAGISVESAVDVARESADIVLTRPDLTLLSRAVEEGRRTFANTRKYVAITASANFGNMVSMALGSGLLPFVPMTAAQILLNNLLSDGPALAIAGDRVEGQHLRRSQHWDLRGLRRFMALFGLLSTVFDLMTFAVLHRLMRVDEAVFQTAWFLTSLLTELAALLTLRTRSPVWRSRPGWTLPLPSAVVGLAAMACVLWPPARAALGFAAMPGAVWAWIAGVVVLYIATTEIAKRIFWRAQS